MILKGSFSVDEPVTLTITGATEKVTQLTLLAKSRVGGLISAKPQRRLVYALAAAGDVKVSLRVGNAGLKRGRNYRIVVVATAADGQTSRLAIPVARVRARSRS